VPRLLAFAASLRRESWNRKLLGLAAQLIEPERQARLASMVGGYLAVARKLAAG